MLDRFLHCPRRLHDQLGAGFAAQGGIQAQVIVFRFAPAVFGVVVVVGRTGAVVLGQRRLPQTVGHVLGAGAGLGVVDAQLQRGVDKGAQHVGAVAQHIVAAAAQHHAAFARGHFLNDVGLQDVDLVGQRHRVAHHVQAVDQAAAALVFAGGDGLLGQAALFSCQRDEFLVVEFDAQKFCHALGDLTAAGCVFARHRDHQRFHSCHLVFHDCVGVYPAHQKYRDFSDTPGPHGPHFNFSIP